MKKAIEKIETRIILICKKNNINFCIDKSEKRIIYTFDDYKLGYIRIDIYLDEKFNLSNVILYGINDELLKIATKIEDNKQLFDLDIQRYDLTRTDYQNTELKVVFEKSTIEEFEKFNNSSDNIYLQNIFLEKKEYRKPTNLAYDNSYVLSKNPVTSVSWKYLRPENYFIGKDEDLTPDENSNINCYFCVNCKNCINCIGCINCTDCIKCTNCYNCTDCNRSSNLTHCINCDECIDCLHCKILFSCDGLIAKSNIGTRSINRDGDDSNQFTNYKFFPDHGSTFYHERIESFFLINRFIPYHRPYDFASNYKWSIQWRITDQKRRYWVTEEPSQKYENRIYTISELAVFFMMNKLKYDKYDLEAYFCECFNLSNVYLTPDSKKLIDKLITPKLEKSYTIYDEIKTKKSQDCLYNYLLYDLHRRK